MDTKPRQLHISQLIKGNYQVWRIQMTAVLVALDLWDVVRPASEVPSKNMPKGPKEVPALQKKREMARSKIVLAIDPSLVPFVTDMESPFNFNLSLHCSFLHMVKKEDESAVSWIGHIRTRALELSYTPCPTTTVGVIIIIKGLPPQYTVHPHPHAA
ncbi:hypothetical protein OH76DRAFT_1490893 [Lentinus brumalis]|uniref:DUF4219 domain-containing protein n=1 Tax=Lentinus brumalis TaxID=2498619 RepID=A0A371CHE4_9APHY|nr:hypothetical protein OH76DRAFT_1490893 [Polyporus brumalis]